LGLLIGRRGNRIVNARCKRKEVTQLPKVVCLVPAHNEEDCLPDAVYSLVKQTRGPDRVIVVADNCTDRTIEVMEPYRAGFCVEVFETVGNRHKKAGALNQALNEILPDLKEEDAVLVMDADSFLDEKFIESAEERLNANTPSVNAYGGVGGTFQGRSGGGFVGTLQRNEFTRYARDVRRLKGKVLCLTGTATLFSVKALKEIAKERPTGEVYDVEVLTEDFELTLALKHLGYEVVSPKECTLTTEVMETWRDLAQQRLRWKRGAVENLVQYGLTRVTLEHWARQLITLLGIFVSAVYLGTVVYSLSVAHGINLYPLWIGVTSIFIAERAVTVYKRGWKMSFLAALLVVEMPFDVFLQAVHLKAYWQVFTRSERSW
jgi:cellulose synthase/poly-beta-1,6-N-acetylglucosamine synthase-like glycosyltransferase